jgi:hypothetical protein
MNLTAGGRGHGYLLRNLAVSPYLLPEQAIFAESQTWPIIVFESAGLNSPGSPMYWKL